MKVTNFVIVGTSKIAERFIEVGQTIPEFVLKGIYSRNLARAKDFAALHGAEKYYDCLEDVAKDPSVDAVYIASPNAVHYEQTIQMLKAKKHVLCEKTMGSNVREVKKMLLEAKLNHVILMEAMRSIYDPGFMAIKENLNKLGVVRRAHFEYCQYSSRYDMFKQGKACNIFSKEMSSGALMDIGVYCVHPMIALFGRPNGVLANPVLLKNGIDGAGTILAKYDQMVVDLSYSKITNGFLPSQIQGEDGTMIISDIPDPRKIKIISRNGDEQEINIEPCENNMVYELQYFMDAVEKGKSPDLAHKISLEAIEIMDTARRQMGVSFPADRRII